MSTFVRSTVASACILMLAACSQKPADQAVDGTSAPASADNVAPAAPMAATPIAPVVDRGNVDFVELELDGSSNQSHQVGSDQSVKGEFATPRDGNVSGYEVQVGNYGNSSVGLLKLKLCQGEKCSEGSADLTGSKDNEYFNIALSAPLAVSTAGGVVTYELTREGGDNRFAVWSYPASLPSSKTTFPPDGQVAARSLKLGLRFDR